GGAGGGGGGDARCGLHRVGEGRNAASSGRADGGAGRVGREDDALGGEFRSRRVRARGRDRRRGGGRVPEIARDHRPPDGGIRARRPSPDQHWRRGRLRGGRGGGERVSGRRVSAIFERVALI